MTRPVRVEFENAVYHVTARGNELKDIYPDPADRQRFLETLEEPVDRFGLVVHAYCLLCNHYHRLLQTPRANLTGALWLQTTYSIRFNRRPGCAPSGSAISAAPEKRPRRATATRSPRCSAGWLLPLGRNSAAAGRMTDLARRYGYRDGSGIHRVIPRLEAHAKEDRTLAQNLKSLAARMPGVILPERPEIQQPPPPIMGVQFLY